ncbi:MULTISPECIES: DUF2752 domain-containing protein [Mycolicibacterium]|jgi:hypothetical protein|uniref:DUF2752 domain-containing protein n=1 Tax=Mycolicibacterium vanbaalenii (strain DSM 7251 / JCM 13017 / BCRC 16820 / KCTC 9966 / NRRL B-24157 / PYR-1) TaxID=350058 RepID=A1T8X8_MYCVP|nr:MULTISPECIES: DUF2752 domain-containing protein [Mycolicibacterium]ABM13628.1 conserved hypothetical protein [Mycolicibacterium vanbaalenii PYR-1]MCV7128446.1 DUF2752 domain-containing protein [Mycolicibacterium vanbaalenii PYR-1]MDW5610359.1 DUF2752 domain-containing protein [Mycolicibacterium sp. D5.8-2]PQP51852.1 DUF2752 domain-containing protein [Mycolicibacterium austroafricanum]
MAPSTTTGTRTRLLVGASGGAATVGALAYIGIGNPHSPSFVFPSCPFNALTGWLCPACGGLRMTHDLLHGDLAAAFVDNPFVLFGLPLLMGWLLIRRRQGRPAFTAPAYVVMITAVLAWTVVRNLPGFPLVPTILDG